MAGARSVMVTLSADVTGFTAAMGKAASSAEQAGNKIAKAVDGHEESLNKIGNAALGMGAVVLAGVGLAVKTFADFGEQMSAVQAATHETDANMQRLTDTAMELGASTAFSATEAAQGTEELAKAGVSTNEIIGGGLSGALDLAAAGGISVAESAETAATAMTQFGLSGKDVPHVADLLAAAAGKAQGGVHDMGEALKQSGLVASQYGVSIEDATGTLAAFASAGLIGSDAGTSFKTMLMRLAAPTGEAADLMDELGITMYDSNGAFVGMSDLAGQLQTSMADMTVEQRNATMATLFGADAVRAANVLYSQGAAGIADWVSAVDDQGYAAETASTKLDNLKGDLEALGGALETAMIGMGAGADGPLRDLVQGITELVDKFNSLPDSVKQGTLIVAALAGAGALAAGGIIKAVTAFSGLYSAVQNVSPLVSTARDKFDTLATSSGKAGTAIRGVGRAAVIAGGMLAALAIVGTIQNSLSGGFTPSVEDAVGALDDLTQSSSSSVTSMTAVNDAFTLSQGWIIKDQVDGLTEAFDRLGKYPFDDTISGIINTLAGTQGDDLTGKITAQFSAFDQAIVRLGTTSAPQAAAAFAQIRAQVDPTGEHLDKLIGLFPQYADQVRSAATAQGITITSTEQLADLMANGLPTAADAATAAANGTATSLEAQATAAKSALEAMQNLGNLMLAQSGSLIGLEAAYDAATESIKENGRTHDLNTEKGRANQQAIDDIAASALKYAEDAVAAGAATDVVTGNLERSRGEFIEAAEAAGYTADQAAALADKYQLIPETVETLVAQVGAEDAKGKVDGLRGSVDSLTGKTVPVGESGSVPAAGRIREMDRTIDSLDGKTVPVSESGATPAKGRISEMDRTIDALDGKTVPVSANVSGTGDVWSLKGALDSLHDKTINIFTKVFGGIPKATGGYMDPAWVGMAGTAAHVGARGFSGGGGYTGPGPRRVDRIPAWLSAREFVQNDRAVDLYGLPFMHALNARAVPVDFIRAMGFASGGSPSSTSASPSPLVGLTRRDVALAVYEGLQMGGYAVVPRADLSLMGGALS